MTSSDTVTSVFHDSIYLSNWLVKRIDLKLWHISKWMMPWLIVHRVYKLFDWSAGNGFCCSSVLCLFFFYCLNCGAGSFFVCFRLYFTKHSIDATIFGMENNVMICIRAGMSAIYTNYLLSTGKDVTNQSLFGCGH